MDYILFFSSDNHQNIRSIRNCINVFGIIGITHIKGMKLGKYQDNEEELRHIYHRRMYIG